MNKRVISFAIALIVAALATFGIVQVRGDEPTNIMLVFYGILAPMALIISISILADMFIPSKKD